MRTAVMPYCAPMFGCGIAWGHHPETAWKPYNGVVRYRHAPPGRLLGAGDPAKLGAIMGNNIFD